MNCARQWGKSTVAATKIVHVALTRPGSTILIVSENLDQTDGVFRKIDRFLKKLGLKARREAHARFLDNGSMIQGLAAREEGVRSYTADFVFIDEAARIDDEVIDALEPSILVNKGDWWMTGMQMAVQVRRFEVDRPRCREWDALRRELSIVRLEGRVTKGKKSQDDLAFALALAIWWGMRL